MSRIQTKMDELISQNPNLLDCGVYIYDHRPHGILQDKDSYQIKVVLESKDDIDQENNNTPNIFVMDYESLKDMLSNDYELKY